MTPPTHRHRSAVAGVFEDKLGLESLTPEIITGLESLLADTSPDWTIFWRQLSHVVASTAGSALGDGELEAALRLLAPAWIREPSRAQQTAVTEWLGLWLRHLQKEGRPVAEVVRGMQSVSPKCVPGGWMRVEAYELAQDRGDYSKVHELQALFRRPYDEQPEMERWETCSWLPCMYACPRGERLAGPAFAGAL